MPITAEAPLGGIIEQLGGESHPLLLRNREVERFEAQHGLGIFEFLDQVLGKGSPQSRHCRDLVALGLVGGGLADRSADHIIDEMPPHENMRIRAIAQDLLMAAFVAPEERKKKADDLAGSSGKAPLKATKHEKKSKAQSGQA